MIRSFAQREAGAGAKLRDQWNPGIDAPAVKGRADSGDIEIDLVELFTDLGGLAADVGKGIAVFVDEMQDLGPDDVSALCAACHEISQSGLPVIVVGAGLPHLPAVLSARASPTPSGCSATSASTGCRARPPTARSPRPRDDEDAAYADDALAAMYAATGGYPYFIQAYGKASGTARRARRSPPTTSRWPRRRPRPSWPSASSAAASSGRRRGSATTCGRWPTPRSRSPSATSEGARRHQASRPPTSPPRSARSRSRSRRPATRCSRRG